MTSDGNPKNGNDESPNQYRLPFYQDFINGALASSLGTTCFSTPLDNYKIGITFAHEIPFEPSVKRLLRNNTTIGIFSLPLLYHIISYHIISYQCNVMMLCSIQNSDACSSKASVALCYQRKFEINKKVLYHYFVYIHMILPEHDW
jgi:hypothetical protein